MCEGKEEAGDKDIVGTLISNEGFEKAGKMSNKIERDQTSMYSKAINSEAQIQKVFKNRKYGKPSRH